MLNNGLDDEELMTVQGLDNYGDYGALYQAPDGSLYQMPGFGDMPGGPGDGVLGEVRQGPDGRLYQWVEGYDGLGAPVGFWSLIPAIASAVLPMAAKALPKLFSAARGAGAGQILQRILPQASRILQQIAPAMPAVQPMAAAQPMPAQPMPAQPMPVAADTSDELTGFGALYQAPDGSLYQIQDAADEERLAEEELIRGLDEDERYGEDEELRDTEGYLRTGGEGRCCCPGIHGMDAYVRPEPPHTPAFVRPAVAPDMWRPLW